MTTYNTHAALVSSETVVGHVELATAAEITTGTDNTRAVHAAGLKVELDKKAALTAYNTHAALVSSETVIGHVELATATETTTGTDGTRAVTPLGLKSVTEVFSAHLADLAYQVAGGTATALTIPTPTLTDGYAKTFITSGNNSGAATTINSKPLYKPGTTIAPNLIAGKAYTVWYNLAGDCFFIKASAEGDAVAGDALAGKKFSNDNDTGLVGSMINRGAVTIMPTADDIVIPVGYHSGAGIVKGVSIFSLSPGTNVFVPSSVMTTNKYTESLTPVKMKDVRINIAGTVRVTFQLVAGDSRETVYGRLYVNGVAKGIIHSTTGSIYFTEDITLKAGDLLQLYAWRAGIYASVAHIWDFYVNISNLLYQVLMDA